MLASAGDSASSSEGDIRMSLRLIDDKTGGPRLGDKSTGRSVLYRRKKGGSAIDFHEERVSRFSRALSHRTKGIQE